MVNIYYVWRTTNDERYCLSYVLIKDQSLPQVVTCLRNQADCVNTNSSVVQSGVESWQIKLADNLYQEFNPDTGLPTGRVTDGNSWCEQEQRYLP